MLQTREVAEAFRQLCFHVEAMQYVWERAKHAQLLSVENDALEALVEALFEAKAPTELKRTAECVRTLVRDLSTYEDRSHSADEARYYVAGTIFRFVKEKCLVGLLRELTAYCRSSNGHSVRLDRLRICCRSLLEVTRSLSEGFTYPEITLNEYMESIVAAEKVSVEVAELTSALLPEMRST